jgi:hypothetical protein
MLRLARPSRRSLAVLVPVALAAVAIPSVAMAAAGDSAHVFRACVDQDGFVWNTVVDGDPACTDADLLKAIRDQMGDQTIVLSEVDWNEKGQDGAPGAKGATGAAGVKGANGVSGYATISKSGSVAKHKTSTLTVSCPTGKKVTGGGANPSSSAVALLASYPASNGSGWVARVSNDSGNAHDVKVYAICAAA